MLNNDYQVIDYKRWLDDLQRHVSIYIPMTDITISSAEFSEKCGKDCWQSTVNCEWPMSFQVTALGKTKQEAERNVSALVCFKLNVSIQVETYLHIFLFLDPKTKPFLLKT